MGFLAQLKGQWLGILIGAAIAFGVSFYFYSISREAREPVFAVDSGRVEIVSAANVATAPIKVLRQDGKPITSDVYAVRLYFWNEGKRSIRPEDVLDTIRVVLDDSASEILDYKVVKVSRPITRISLVRGTSLRALELKFGILEHGDGFAAQIIYQGRKGVPLRVAGSVDGGDVRPASSASLVTAILTVVGGGILLLVTVFGGFAIIALSVEYGLKPFVRWIWPGSVSVKVPRRLKYTFIALLIAGFVVLMGYALAQQDATVVTNYVPASLTK